MLNLVNIPSLSFLLAWQGPWRGKDDRQGGPGQGMNQGGMFGRNNRDGGKFGGGNRESNKYGEGGRNVKFSDDRKFGNDRQNGEN